MGLEKFLEKKDVNKLADSLAVTILHTLEETQSTVKIAPNIIKNAANNMNKIAKERIDQVIKTGGTEIECIAPKIIRGAIEEVYKTPFRLLGNLGKKQFQKIKRRFFK